MSPSRPRVAILDNTHVGHYELFFHAQQNINLLLKSYSITIFILSIIKIMNGRELHPGLD